MPTKDPRVDAYIASAAPFARPILKRLRALVHEGCPEVVETIKWKMPAFEHEGPLCGMAAFKAHCVFGFWKAALLFGGASAKGMARLDWGAPGRDPLPARITSIDDLPSRTVMLRLVREAVKLNEAGVKVPKRAIPRAAPVVPADLAAALKKSRKAAAHFEAFSPSCRREYVEWITEAKRDETRQRRIATAIEWLAEGKQRNWKYQGKR